MMPRASSNGLAPSITDSPNATYPWSCKMVVVVAGIVVDVVGAAVWPGATVTAGFEAMTAEEAIDAGSVTGGAVRTVPRAA